MLAKHEGPVCPYWFGMDMISNLCGKARGRVYDVMHFLRACDLWMLGTDRAVDTIVVGDSRTMRSSHNDQISVKNKIEASPTNLFGTKLALRVGALYYHLANQRRGRAVHVRDQTSWTLQVCRITGFTRHVRTLCDVRHPVGFVKAVQALQYSIAASQLAT